MIGLCTHAIIRVYFLPRTYRNVTLLDPAHLPKVCPTAWPYSVEELLESFFVGVRGGDQEALRGEHFGLI